MLTITAQQIEDADFALADAACSAIDFATVAQAHRNSEAGFDGCELDVAWALFLKPAEDITVPIFVCSIHFNAFKYAVKSGRVAVDLNVFGEID